MSGNETVAELRRQADELMVMLHGQLNSKGQSLTDQEFAQLLGDWVSRASNKLVACRQVIASCAARRESYEGEIEAFAVLVERESKAIDRVNDYALMLLDKELEVANATAEEGKSVDKVKLPDGSWAKLYLGKGRLVNVTNWDMLPQEFVVSRADKAAIRDAIKAGHSVPGAEIVESHKPARVQWGGRRKK